MPWHAMLTPLVALVALPPCHGLVLEPGTAWSYRAEAVWDAGGADSTARQSFPWTTTIISVHESNAGVAALVSGWPTDLAWWTPGRAPSTSVLYCTATSIYLFHPQAGTASELIEALFSGRQAPALDNLIFSLPLHTGAVFGRDPAERQDNFYACTITTAPRQRARPGWSRTSRGHGRVGVQALTWTSRRARGRSRAGRATRHRAAGGNACLDLPG